MPALLGVGVKEKMAPFHMTGLSLSQDTILFLLLEIQFEGDKPYLLSIQFKVFGFSIWHLRQNSYTRARSLGG